MNEAWAAITAGIIAAAAGCIGLVMTKENKTSEFRQQWIQELRSVLTEYSSTLSAICTSVRNGHKTDPSELKKINMLLCELHLRINYAKQSSEEKKLNEALIDLQDKAFNGSKDFANSQEKFTAASFAVLKKEWKRVKKGEKIYRVCMYPCLLITGVSVIASLIYMVRHYEAIWHLIVN